MSCPDENQLIELVQGLISPDRSREIHGHIDACVTCRRLLAAYARASSAERDPESAELEAASTVADRYTIIDVVGTGAMSVVYAAYDRVLDRRIALKVLRDTNPRQAGRLEREARVMAKLASPHVVPVYDVGLINGRMFLTAELVSGSTLATWIAAERDHPWRQVVGVFLQAARGLAAAHAAGVAHRDFKPSNVLIGEDGRVRVADFGLAHQVVEAPVTNASNAAPAPVALGSASTRTSASCGTPASCAPTLPEVSDETRHPADPAMTRTGWLLGTPAYMAPEQLRGEPADARSDQFAFCVSMFEALHGYRPFGAPDGRTLQDLLAAIMHGTRARTTRRLPGRIVRLIDRGLASDPAHRARSREVVVSELERSLVRPGVRPTSIVAAIAIALVCGAAGIEATSSSEDPPVTSCADGAGVIDQIWSQQQRTRLLESFGRLRPSNAIANLSMTHIVDDWVGGWRLARVAACRADEEHRIARVACLDQDLHELRAQLAVWDTADTEVVDRAITTARELPAPADCATRGGQPIPPPIAIQLANLHALERAGHARAAKPGIDELLRLMTTRQEPTTSAAVLLEAGRIAFANGELEPARAYLVRAAREAGGAGADDNLIDALLLQSSVVIDQGRPVDSLGQLDAAQAIMARIGIDRSQRLGRVRAAALIQVGRSLDAIAELRPLIAILDARTPPDPATQIDLASALGVLAGAYTERGEPSQAHDLLTRTLDLEISVLGPNHPEVGKTLHDLATSDERLGRYDDATERLTRARAIFVGAYGERHTLVGNTDLSLAGLALHRGKLDDARILYKAAQATLAGLLPADHPDVALIEYGLGALERDSDHCGDAIPHYERVLAIYERTGVAGMKHGRLLVNLSACLSEGRRWIEARTRVEHGLAELVAAQATDHDQAEAWMLLADLNWRDGQRTKAIALTNQVIVATKDDPDPAFQELHSYARDQLAMWTR